MINEQPADPVDQASKASGQDDQTSSNQQTTVEPKTEDKVSYESYKKVLGEKKNASEKLAQMQAELEKLREEKLVAEGNKDQLLEDYKKKFEDTKALLEEKDKKFAWQKISSTIKTEALKHGCLNPDKLIRLMSDEQLNKIEMSENFEINNDSVNQVLEEAIKENNFLFKKQMNIADGGPSQSSPQAKPASLRDALSNYVNNLK